MPTPLSDETKDQLGKFLETQSIPPNVPLDMVSHREGRAVCHLHHGGLDYTLKLFTSGTPELQEQYVREQIFYDAIKPLQTGKTPLLVANSSDPFILLLSRIAGRGVRETEINRGAIKQAATFLAQINQPDTSATNDISHLAQNACLSIKDHLTETATLVTQVQAYQSSVNPQTAAFIADEIVPLWQKTLANTIEQFQTLGVDVDTPLDGGHLMLSPGELGFHNAILTPEKELCFVDFDQSGWDDPARVINRFFTLGPIPPKEDHRDIVVESLANMDRLDPHFAIRAKILLAAYQINRACQPILRCLEEGNASSTAEGSATHSKTKLIAITNRSRQWLIKANQSS